MIGATLAVKQLKSGNWKACIWGRADGHISDWTGCNFRIKSLEDQPFRGFKTREEAEDFGKSQFPNQEAVKAYGKRAGDGSHMGDSKTYEWDTVSLPQGEICEMCASNDRVFTELPKYEANYKTKFGSRKRKVCEKHKQEMETNEQGRYQEVNFELLEEAE